MGAATTRSSGSPGRPVGYLGFGAVIVGSAALFTAVPLAGLPARLPHLPAAFWLMALLAVVCDARPFTPVGRRRSSAVFPSICFTFAILLAWGFALAVAVQTLAAALSGRPQRHPASRTG